MLADPSFHPRRLLYFLAAVLDRPHPRPGRSERVHVHELVADPRALHPHPDEQARHYGSVLHRPHWRLPHRALHLRTGQATLGRSPPRLFYL